MATPLPKVKGIECEKYIPEIKENKIKFKGMCQLTKDAPPSIAFIGDSHLIHYRNAIWNNFDSESALVAVQYNCLPFTGSRFSESKRCKQKYNVLTRYLESSTSIKTVVLSAHWAYLMSGGVGSKGEGWRLAKPLTETDAQIFQESGVKMITKLLNSGKKVVFLKDIPDLGFNIKNCFDIRPLRLTTFSTLNQGCFHNQQEYIERMAPYDAVIDEMLKKLPSITVYNPRSLFCENGKCKGKGDFLPYYLDGDHLNHYGASKVFEDLLKTVDLKGK